MDNISNTWKSSVQPRKQRKWLLYAPLHARNKVMSATLTKTLRDKLNARNIPLRKGDKVKVLRGQFKGKIGAVTKVDLRKYQIVIDGVDFTKKNGSKITYPIHPSKVMILELHDDKKRLKRSNKEEKKTQNKEKVATKA